MLIDILYTFHPHQILQTHPIITGVSRSYSKPTRKQNPISGKIECIRSPPWKQGSIIVEIPGVIIERSKKIVAMPLLGIDAEISVSLGVTYCFTFFIIFF